MSVAPVVRVENTASLVRETVAAMQAWAHWPEIARGAQKDYGLSEEDFFRILPEYQRFMALLRCYPGLGMLSEHVDILWHSLILNTRRYQEFCDQFIGRFVHHLPCTSYVLYGFSPHEAADSSICKEPPATCTDPWPAPPDPSPLPGKLVSQQPYEETVRESIRTGSARFVAAYTHVFGIAPNTEIWPRVTLVDAITQ